MRQRKKEERMLPRRSFMTGALAVGLAAKARAAEPLQVFSADVRPLSIAEGPRRGLVLDVVRDAATAIGREVRFTFLPFADAMKRTAETPGALIAPFARSPQRETGYTWVAKIIDVPQALGTLTDRPTADLEAGRKLSRIGVVRNGVQETFLRDQGLTNLQTFTTAREIAEALARRDIDAWYATATEITLQFENIGKAGQVHLGPPLQLAPAWLAANRDAAGLPVAELAAAIAQLEQSGRIQQHYRSYVPS
jgi:hypothetical protein